MKQLDFCECKARCFTQSLTFQHGYITKQTNKKKIVLNFQRPKEQTRQIAFTCLEAQLFLRNDYYSCQGYFSSLWKGERSRDMGEIMNHQISVHLRSCKLCSIDNCDWTLSTWVD